MTEREEHLVSIGRTDLVYTNRLLGDVRGGSAPEADMDTDYGHDLLIDQTEKLPSDFDALDEMIQAAEQTDSLDALQIADCAQTLRTIEREFYVDGEPFQIKEDGELNVWVRQTLAELHPDVSEFDVDRIVRGVDGFPPRNRTQDEYELAD